MSKQITRPAPEHSVKTPASHLTPEAIIKAIDLIGTIVLGSMQLAAERTRFEQDLARLRVGTESTDRRLQQLLELIDKTVLTDEARNRVVETVCELSLR